MTHTDSMIAEAELLTEPGRVYEPAAEKVVAGADKAIGDRGGPTTEGERRICRQAERLRLYAPSADPKPQVSPERAARKAAEKTEVDRHQLLTDAALEAVVVAQARELRATTPDEGRCLAAERQAAEAAFAVERESLERAIATLNTT